MTDFVATRKAGVDSSMLSEVAYNDEDRTLAVRFVRGGVYVYSDVPSWEFEALTDPDESAGSYYRDEIRGYYTSERQDDSTKFVFSGETTAPVEEKPQFNVGDVVEIQPDFSLRESDVWEGWFEQWRGLRCEVVEHNGSSWRGNDKTWLHPLTNRPDGSQTDFWWPSADLVKVVEPTAAPVEETKSLSRVVVNWVDENGNYREDEVTFTGTFLGIEVDTLD